jgi:hypothetical protein
MPNPQFLADWGSGENAQENAAESTNRQERVPKKHTLWLLYTILFGFLGRLFSAEKILQDTYVCMYEYVDLHGGDIKYNHGYYIRGREILLSLLCTYSKYI